MTGGLVGAGRSNAFGEQVQIVGDDAVVAAVTAVTVVTVTVGTVVAVLVAASPSPGDKHSHLGDERGGGRWEEVVRALVLPALVPVQGWA